ncbi:MAG TPA: transglycosylase SLT domain-containing protein [Gemmatimonadaceae bacterium]|nr:transglycosylase SLT domain-containing protein [Gemmatimonadaceae bacterium]
MRRSTVDYVHRGDLLRRRERIRRWVLGIGFLGAVTLFASLKQSEAGATGTSLFTSRESRLQASLDSAVGELNLAKAELERARRVLELSGRYRVAADLAADIYDIALAEGIEPELGFRLVRTESEFRERATSPVGAIGLTQVMLPTARYFDKQITEKRLYDRKTNLRIGFRYLRTLIKEQKGDVRMALLVYNRGPVAVNAAIAQGLDPANGYDRVVMKGYHGRGTVD